MKSITLLVGAALVSAASAQVTQMVGPSANSPIALDFDNPFVASGPIATNSPIFQAAGITSVTLVGSWAPGGDTLTAASNVMGQGLISQGGALRVATSPEPLDNGAANAGFDIVLAQPHNEFQVLFIDQVNHSYRIELFSGATSLGLGNFVYSGGFPNPPHYWTGTGPFDRVLITFPNGSQVSGSTTSPSTAARRRSARATAALRSRTPRATPAPCPLRAAPVSQRTTSSCRPTTCPRTHSASS